MAEREKRRITEQELRDAELQMSGRPPASATGFIGFVPAAPTTDATAGSGENGSQPPVGTGDDSGNGNRS
jgi:hypothetical protein